MAKTRLLPKVLKAFGISVAGNIGFLCYYLPNTVFLKQLQELTQSYKGNMPEHVSYNVKLLFDDVVSDMKMDKDKKNIRLYKGVSFDFFYAGSVWKKLIGFEEAIIGVPSFYCLDNFLPELKKKLNCHDMKLDWSGEAAKKFEESLFISDKAKKFGLAQNLFYVSTSEPLYKGGVTAFMTVFCLQFLYFISNSERYQDKRFRFLRYSMVFTCVVCNISLWLLFQDAHTCYLEKQADEAVAKLGKDYIEGGVEYYNSILDRNVALLNMTGKKAPVTLFGNEIMTIRQKHLPITGRRDYFKELSNQ